MAPKRAAKRSAPPLLVASSQEVDSMSSSEDEETTADPLTLTSEKNPPASVQEAEPSDTSDEEEEEEEPSRVAPPPALKNPPPPLRQGKESDTSDEEEEVAESESDEEAPPPKPAPEQKADGLKPLSPVNTKKQTAPSLRIWSAADEIRILEALAAHRRQHSVLPQPDELFATLNGSLDNRAFGSKDLMGKVKALRSRYTTLTKRLDIPSKEHDRRVLELAMIIWDPAAAVTKVNGLSPREFADQCKMFPYLAEEVNLLDAAHLGMFKKPFVKIDDDKARALDVKIKKQRVLRTRQEMRRCDLDREVKRLLLDLLGSC